MAWLCAYCYDDAEGFVPDMGDGIEWKDSNCDTCDRKNIIVFKELGDYASI